jgi:predicted phage tail protein
MTEFIAGSGGGGGGKGGGGGSQQRTPTEEASSLFSASYAKVVDLLSEGEISGLKDGLKSVYFNNTPVQNPDNSYNFSDVTILTRTGTQNQSYLDGFDEIANEFNVGTTVVQATPIVRTITDVSVDGARVLITVPALQRITDQGDIVGSVFRLQISVQRNGGGYTTVVDDTIRGRTASPYQRNYLLQGFNSGPFPIDIKVTRITADSSEQDVGGSSAKITNAFAWTSYSEITWGKLAYPNSALAAIRINAEQFSSIPSRTYLVRGVKVSIPNIATVDQTTGALIYSGVWGGSFGAAQWTSDPAWCLYDLLTNTRYGFGDHLAAAQLDKWAFFSASQYCSALDTYTTAAEIAERAARGLPPRTGTTNNYNSTTGKHGIYDGFGGYEPRFSCNVNIQTAEDAYKLINDMCSVFRAMPYWNVGSLTFAQDKPVDSSYLFTYANVSEEGFTYSGSSLKTRPNVAVVQYLDPITRDTAYEVVEDPEGIEKYGVVKTELIAFACTSRGQAQRLGEWLIYSNKHETETVSFTASMDAGVLVRPGQVIEISDPVRAGVRRGGRIISATTTAVTVDDATGISATSSPTLSVITPTGTVETRNVSTVVGNVITVSSAYTTAPNPYSVWIFETSTLQTSTWRVLTVEEQEQCTYAITALAYNASKYAYVERGVALQTRTTSNLNAIPDPPTNLTLVEALYTYRDQISSKLIISWAPVSGINQYEVRYRKDSANWTTVQRQQPDYEVLDTTPGYFEIEVYSRNAGGQNSTTPLTGTKNVLGKTAPPANVPALRVQSDPDVGITLNWDPVTDLDLQGYEIWQGPAWGSGVKLGLFAATSKKLGIVSAGTTQWWIKALDTSGIYSLAATSASITITAATAPNVSSSFAAGDCILSWNAVSGSVSTAYYTIRYGSVGGSFGSAQEISTVKGTTAAVRADWSGVRRFYVAAVSLSGDVGSAGFVDVTVTAPTAPIIRQEVIDNNVLLRWTDSTATLPIVYYELRRGATWAAGTPIGTKQGLFTVVFETVSGLYTYWVAGVDSAGNVGTPASVSAQVNQPPDYLLRANVDSTLNGTKTNLAVNGTSGLLATVNTTETWQDHFSSRGWSTPQDQIDAGYPIYALPSTTTGSYVEEFDFGAILAGTKITSTLTSQAVYGTVTVAPTLSVKTASGDPYTDYTNQDSIYATNFRYVKVTYAFTSTGNDDLLNISALNVRLDVKLRSDTGTGTANAADVGGTTVNFNVAFIDVEGISVTPSGTTARIAIYDFVDAPNPTSFKVLLFDTAGNRVSGAFSWQARGS